MGGGRMEHVTPTLFHSIVGKLVVAIISLE
jgi:hypothetical protein